MIICPNYKYTKVQQLSSVSGLRIFLWMKVKEEKHSLTENERKPKHPGHINNRKKKKKKDKIEKK